MRRLSSTRPGAWLFARVAHRLDKPVWRISRGRFTAASVVAGIPMAMVTTTGAKSGAPRTVPLLALPTPDGLAVISSSFGRRNHPGWYHNLRKNPGGTVAVKGERWAFRAVEAEGERRERIWAEALRTYPGYANYETRASHRRIAVWILEPAP